MMSQKEAVYTATMEILRQANIPYDGEPIKQLMPKEVRKLVTYKLLEYALNNEIKFSKTDSNIQRLNDKKKLTAYLSSLICNHWNRDKRLNGSLKGV